MRPCGASGRACPEAAGAALGCSPDAARAQLDAAGFASTAILCDDNHYNCAPDILTDPALAAAVAVVGGHGVPTAAAMQTGKTLWFSEDFHSTGSETGAGT